MGAWTNGMCMVCISVLTMRNAFESDYGRLFKEVIMCIRVLWHRLQVSDDLNPVRSRP